MEELARGPELESDETAEEEVKKKRKKHLRCWKENGMSGRPAEPHGWGAKMEEGRREELAGAKPDATGSREGHGDVVGWADGGVPGMTH